MPGIASSQLAQSLRAAGSNRLGGRILFIALAAAFIAAFQTVYIQDISPVFSYIGITYSPLSGVEEIFAWFFALGPSFFLEIALTRPSQFILMLFYILVYISSIFVPLYMRLQPFPNLMVLSVTLFLGFLLMITMLRPNTIPSARRERSDETFWAVLWGLYFLCALWIIGVFGSSLRLVSFSDVYSSGLRFESRDIFAKSSVGFAVLMMCGAINPLLIALGLQNRKKLLVLAGIGGQLLCYSTGGLKAIILSVVMIMLLHFVIRKYLLFAAHALLTVSIILLLACHVCSLSLGNTSPAALVFESLVSRSVIIPGQLTAQYHDFFVSHPHLYLSNIKPFSWVVPNPLGKPVINAISEYYAGDDEMTSNAHIWAQDGIANFGLPGVLVISFLAAMVLRVMDRVSASHDPCFAAMAFSVAGYNLTNAPLSTALLSGGLMLSFVLIWLSNAKTGTRRQRQGKARTCSVAKATTIPLRAESQ